MSNRWNNHWEHQMRDLSLSAHIHVDRMIGVYTGDRSYHFDGVDVLPVSEFLNQLHAGEIF